MKPKVAIIADSVTPYRLTLHRRLVREMAEIEIHSAFTHEVSNSPWNLPVDSSLRPVFFGRGETSSHRSWGHEWKKASRIIQWLDQQAISAVVLFGYNDPGRMRILTSCCSKGRPCFIFGDSNSRGDLARGWKRLVKRLGLPLVLRLAEGIMYCGTRGQEYFSNYGFPPDRMFPFPYEADYAHIAAVSPERALQARSRFGVPPNAPFLLFSGRLVQEKNPVLLLRAFEQIHRLRNQWHLVFAGDGPLRGNLEEMAAAFASERVRFTGFLHDPDTLAALYAAADVLVLPSSYEPWGVVVTEGAVHSALVCSDRVGAAADLIRDGQNGFVFKSGSLDSLAGALLKVTDAERLLALRTTSPQVLGEWRERTNPVEGLRRALRFANVLPNSA